MPKQTWTEEDESYATTPGWILLVTDNQALANILNATVKYDGGNLIVDQNLQILRTILLLLLMGIGGAVAHWIISRGDPENKIK